MTHLERGADCTVCDFTFRGPEAFTALMGHYTDTGHDVKYWVKMPISAELAARLDPTTVEHMVHAEMSKRFIEAGLIEAAREPIGITNAPPIVGTVD